METNNCIQLLIYSDLENWNGTDRLHFNAIVPDQDLVEVNRQTACASKFNNLVEPCMPLQ